MTALITKKAALCLLLIIQGIILILPFRFLEENRHVWDEMEGPRENATAFIKQQFDDWKDGNCQAFVDSFTDDLQVCDWSKECITDKKELLDGCELFTGGEGGVGKYQLDVYPMRTPRPNYDHVAATGRQQYLRVDGCFEFSIAEELHTQPDGSIKSSLWKAFYVVVHHPCDFEETT